MELNQFRGDTNHQIISKTQTLNKLLWISQTMGSNSLHAQLSLVWWVGNGEATVWPSEYTYEQLSYENNDVYKYEYRNVRNEINLFLVHLKIVYNINYLLTLLHKQI